jgi:hypothetical protein
LHVLVCRSDVRALALAILGDEFLCSKLQRAGSGTVMCLKVIESTAGEVQYVVSFERAQVQ